MKTNTINLNVTMKVPYPCDAEFAAYLLHETILLGLRKADELNESGQCGQLHEDICKFIGLNATQVEIL